MSSKRKDVTPRGAAAAAAAVVEDPTDISACMERMTLGHEFESILDLVQELVERLNYLAVRVEEVNASVMEATVDP